MTSHQKQVPLLDASIRLDSLPAAGRPLEVNAGKEQRAALAEILQVASVEHFAASLQATPFKGGIRVHGRVDAGITQPCVVTFAPVVQTIAEPVDRIFLPGKEAPPTATAGSEVFVDLEGEDLPDYFQGPEIDLSDLLVEIVALAIDPYPRAPDARVENLPEGNSTVETSPFARLRDLKSTGD